MLKTTKIRVYKVSDMTSRLLTTVLLLGLFIPVGCRKSSQSVVPLGITTGSRSTDDKNAEDMFVFQYRTGVDPNTKNVPVFAIFWKRTGGAATTRMDIDNHLLMINSHKIHFDPSKIAVYALQPDFGIKEISLSAEEKAHVFELVQENERGYFENDSVWKTKINPQLITFDMHIRE